MEEDLFVMAMEKYLSIQGVAISVISSIADQANILSLELVILIQFVHVLNYILLFASCRAYSQCSSSNLLFRFPSPPPCLFRINLFSAGSP